DLAGNPPAVRDDGAFFIRMNTQTGMHNKTAWLLVLYILLAPAQTFASAAEELKKTEEALKKSRTEQAQLEEKQKKLESELVYIQNRLVKAATAAQKSEAILARAQEKADALATEIKQQETRLAIGRKNLAALLQGALNLSRMPPEAMVLLPGG